MKHQIVLVVNQGDDVVMMGQVFFGVSDTYGTNPRPYDYFLFTPPVVESRIIFIMRHSCSHIATVFRQIRSNVQIIRIQSVYCHHLQSDCNNLALSPILC